MPSLERTLNRYDYSLPPELIAQEPTSPRDSARLLVYNRATKKISLDTFAHLADYLPPRSVIVFNKTKVIPARFEITKETGGKARLLYIETKNDLIKVLSDRRLSIGSTIQVSRSKHLLVSRQEEKFYFLKPHFPPNQFMSLLNRHGEPPIPPYIKNSPLSGSALKEKYQTVFAQTAGSIAAPTASLHFSRRLLSALKKRGHSIVFITLHVGLGTFAPLAQENIQTGRLHTEYYSISSATARFLNTAKIQSRPIIAVGTTVVRTLETAVQKNKLHNLIGKTSLFIREGYSFKFVDQLITNFHVPRSSLLMLVASLIGRKKLLDIYKTAKENKFRFFSFGDGMYIQ